MWEAWERVCKTEDMCMPYGKYLYNPGYPGFREKCRMGWFLIAIVV